jgi:hypothetical protein
VAAALPAAKRSIIFVLVAVKAPSVSRRILPGMPINKLQQDSEVAAAAMLGPF